MNCLFTSIPFIVVFFSQKLFSQTIACGSAHTIMICNDSTINAWGWNANGELGNGTNVNSSFPVSVNFLTQIIGITAGSFHSLSLKNDSTVWVWGNNQYGQLGNGTNINSNVPIQVNSLTDIIAIAGGYGHSLALKSDSTVWTWGENNYGQLGNGSNADSNLPGQITNLTGIIAVAAGQYHSLALKSDGSVWAWGFNLYGSLGNGNNINSNIPVQTSSLTGITGIAAGAYYSLALRNDGTVRAWGQNSFGQLGNGNSFNSNFPVSVSLLTAITAIACGGYHSLALKNDSTVWLWGNNSEGQLGNGTTGGISNVPLQANIISGVTAIAGGSQHSIAFKYNDTLWAWGRNVEGQLGIGNYTDSNTPLQVTSLCQTITEINEITEAAGIAIFPNPSSGLFTISMEDVAGQMGDGEIEIYNSLGELIFSSRLRTPDSRLDLSSQPPGIYFCKIISGTQVFTQKLIISKTNQ